MTTTIEKLRKQYATIDRNLILPALDYLKGHIAESDKLEIKTYAEDDPHTWWANSHLGWGMAIRNKLRDGRFNEAYFGIENLDDIYICLVEEALGIWHPEESTEEREDRSVNKMTRNEEFDNAEWIKREYRTEDAFMFECRIQALRAASCLADNGNEIFQWDGKNIRANEYILNVANTYALWLEAGEQDG